MRNGEGFPAEQFTVMDRDRRLTGFLRGQTDNVEAPPGFELNNPWTVGALLLVLSPDYADGTERSLRSGLRKGSESKNALAHLYALCLCALNATITLCLQD